MNQSDKRFDPISWIESNLDLAETDTTSFIYDLVESQSGRCLPIIYEPFDPDHPSHFADRGNVFDFMPSKGGRVLDFGPGDGWPSLIVAQYCDEVVGVDGSAKRVAVCQANATRLGITNIRFVHVSPGTPLPFDSDSFDGAMAASSVEQTPEPRAVLTELHRVLKPGGRLRLHYEALGRYRGGQERDLWLWRDEERPRHLIIYDRYIDKEYAKQYRLTLDLAGDEVEDIFRRHGQKVSFSGLTEAVLAELKRHVTAAAVCETQHPSGATLARWLAEVGFAKVLPTHRGARFAKRLFEKLLNEQRPRTIEGIDALLKPLVEIVVALPAPIEDDPMITAIK